MNLAKLFNKKFLMQNLKKSTGILAVILGLVPIINFVMMLVYATQGEFTAGLTLLNISVVTIVFMFIIPVVLSICLFGYVFKKRSVDFVGSMPISKESIFFTNTVGGILILIALVIINVIIFGIFSLLFPFIIIPISMLVDYLILWVISYIFVFIVTNLAMSFSGNMITQIIVTALILFLVPFMFSHITNTFQQYQYNTSRITCNDADCKPTTYSCLEYDSKICNENKRLGIYNANIHEMKDRNFTMPYNLLSTTIFEDNANSIYSTIGILKMVGLSIIYFGVGLYLFKRRKMEECETSFKSNHKHTIVKLLTMYPILAITLDFTAFENTPILLIIVLVVICAYFFIYDLITRKSINEIKKSLIYLVIFIFLMSGINISLRQYHENNILKFSVDDIKEISLNEPLINDVFSQDKDMINIVIKNSLESQQWNNVQYGEFIIKLKNGKKYLVGAQILKDDYKKISNSLNKDNSIVKAYNDFEFDKVYSIMLGDYLVKSKDYKDLIEMVQKHVEKYKVEDIIITDDIYYNNVSVSLYTYINHEIKELRIYTDLSEELTKYLARFYNNRGADLFKKNYNWAYVDNVYFSNKKEYIDEEFRYLASNMSNRFISFIKRETIKPFDETREYIILNYNIDNHILKLYTNNVSGFEKLVEEVRTIYKDTDEYKNMMNMYNSDGTVKGYK